MTITITLPDHIRAWIDRHVAEGRFESEVAVIANAVEQAMDEYRWDEDPELLAAIEEADRGDVVPWTPKLMDELMERARENSRRGHRVSDDIKY